MSTLTDLFVSKKELARRALQEKLVSARTLDDGFSVEKIMPLYHGEYDEGLLDTILAQKPKSEKNGKNRTTNQKLMMAQGSARYLKDMKAAEIALQKGDTAPAVSLAVKGRYHAFREVTKDTSNVHALAAKASLWTKKEFHNPPGDHGDPSFNNIKAFAASQARQAVEGYGALNMTAECEQAMRSYVENTHFEEDAYFSTWKKQFHDGKPDNEAKSKAVYNIIKFDQRGGASFEDHMAAAQFIQDDAVREKAIQSMSGMMKVTNEFRYSQGSANRILNQEQQDRLFEFLAQHIKTTDGKPKPSQAAAMKSLMQNHTARFKSDGFDPISPEGEDLIATIQDELRMGSPHVVQEAFVNGDMLDIIEFNECAVRKKNSFNLKITNILPSELEGVQVDQARNAIGQKLLTDMARRIGQRNYDVNKEARNVALLSRDVIRGSGKFGSPEVKQAADNLAATITVETNAARIDHDNMHKDLSTAGVARYQEEDYLRVFQKNFGQRHPGNGYGRAMLDALKTHALRDENKKVSVIVKDIERRLPESFTPDFQKVQMPAQNM